MTYHTIGGISASRIAQGCMRIDRLSKAELDGLIRSDLDAGISFFEHADIYGGNGRCASTPSSRGNRDRSTGDSPLFGYIPTGVQLQMIDASACRCSFS